MVGLCSHVIMVAEGRGRKWKDVEQETEGGVVVAMVMMLNAGGLYQEMLSAKQHSHCWQCSKRSCKRSRTRSTK